MGQHAPCISTDRAEAPVSLRTICFHYQARGRESQLPHAGKKMKGKRGDAFVVGLRKERMLVAGCLERRPREENGVRTDTAPAFFFKHASF